MSEVAAPISGSIESEIKRRSRSKGTDFEAELARALHSGRILMEIEEAEKENAFLSRRVRFMEESIPQLESEIRWLATAIQQAEKDQELMRRIVQNGDDHQHVETRGRNRERSIGRGSTG
jgi:hypothetical protein